MKKIYVDFDGTLAYFDVWQGETHTGNSIPLMVQKVKEALNRGDSITIYSARLTGESVYVSDPGMSRRVIEDWCIRNLGQKLPVTNIKGPADEFWDDRSIRIIKNTGLTMGEFLGSLIESELQTSTDYKQTLQNLLEVIKNLES